MKTAMRNIQRWIAVLLCVGMALLLCPISALAVEVDYDRAGVLQVKLETTPEREDWSNFEFSLYRIGDIVNENGGLRYVTSGNYVASGVSLDYTTGQEAEAVALRLDSFVQSHGLTPRETGRTDASGAVEFSNLEPGVYFVRLTGGPDWLEAMPFVITVPYYKAGGLLYSVTAHPKHSLTTPTPSPSVSPSPSPTPRPGGGGGGGGGSKLPQTGVVRWPIVALSAGGCLLIVLGAVLALKKKKGKRDR